MYMLVSNLICYDSCAKQAKQDVKYFHRPRNLFVAVYSFLTLTSDINIIDQFYLFFDFI